MTRAGVPVLALVALPLPLLWSWLSARLDAYAARHAETIASSFCSSLGPLACPSPLLISVEDKLPPQIAAHTTLDDSGTGCTLHFTRDSVTRDWTIAHEVCHCAHDHQVLDHDGYRWTVPLAERTRREAAAQACGEKLMERR